VLYDKICHHALSGPNNIALVYNGDKANYADFANVISETMSVLQKLEFPKDGFVAVIVKNIAKGAVMGIAARSIGLHTVAVRALNEIPKGVVVGSVLYLEGEGAEAEEVSGVLPGVPRFVVSQHWKKSGKFAGISDARVGECGDHLLLTSGTTGSSKALRLPGALEDQRNDARALTIGLDAESIFHSMSFGVWTSGGYKQSSAMWHFGRSIVWDQRQNQLLNYAGENSNQIYMLPADIMKLMKLYDADNHQLKTSTTLIGMSSGFVSKRIMDFIREKMSRNIIVRYSAAEVIEVPLERLDDGSDDFHWLDVTPGNHVEIVDDQDAEVPDGDEGILRIRLKPHDPQGYLGNETASAAVFRDGFFYPGDMAVRRSDGRIRILGRVADVINLHGHKTAVAPLEFSIQNLLSADDVCVFIHMNAKGEEEMLIAVQSSVAPKEDQVSLLRSKFRAMESFRVETVPEFPRSDSGTRKVQRSVLKAMLTAQ
jgi:acyl-coenzyme A synthetase/AMP-(fatty) acid ligase